MNLNPLENEKCLYDIEDIYEIDVTKYEDWSCTNLEQKKDLDKNSIPCEDNNYTYLLKSITDKIDWIIKAEDNDYQGDIFYVGRDKEDKYYFLVQGYGSCSGCDAYQGAEFDCEHNKNLKPLNELREDMKRNIRQFENLEEFKIYLESEETRGNFFWYGDDIKDFIKKVNDKFGWSLKTDENF